MKSFLKIALVVPFVSLASMIAGCTSQVEDGADPSMDHADVGARMYEPSPAPIASTVPGSGTIFIPYANLVPMAEQVGPGVIYPVEACAKNTGNVASSPTTIQVTCAKYKNGAYVGPCLSAISEPLAAIDPGKLACPSLPYAPLLGCLSNKGAVTDCKVMVSVGGSTSSFDVPAQ